MTELMNFCKRCDATVPVSDTGRCLKHGSLTKGFSGNTKGRKAKDKPAEIDSEKYGSDAVKALEHMLETSTSRSEAYRLAKDLAPYQKPKLASIESKEHKETKIVIEWIGEADQKPIKVVEEITKEEIVGDSDKLLTEALKGVDIDI